MASRALTAPAASPGWPRVGRRPAVAAGLLVALLGAMALRSVSAELRPGEVARAFHAIPPARIAASIALTAVSYALLTCYDRIGLAAVGKRQPWPTTALGAFTAHAFGYNLGLPWLTANAARYRVHRHAGVSVADVARVGAIGTLAFWTGVAMLAGLALLVSPGAMPWLAPAGSSLSGGALLLVAGMPAMLSLAGVRRIGWRQAAVPLPEARALGMIAIVSVADLLAAAAALFVLLPSASAGAAPAFFLAYALAIVVAALSHVPGGLGVFEAAVLATVPADRPAVLAALLLYRVIYYLGPLGLAAGAIAAGEAGGARRRFAPAYALIGKAARFVAPAAATLLVFASGCVLLASGALPGVGNRLSRLDDVVPLPFIEGSHLGGSLVGTALLLVAPALHARLRSGWLVARPLLLAGALFSLMKGLDYEEASLQLCVLALLHHARSGFYKRGGVATEPLDWRWLLAAALALALSIGAGLLAYANVPYSDQLWWRFALDGDAPRFLRATFAAGVLLSAAALWQLFLGRAPRGAASFLPPEVATRALAVTLRTDANLAFTGDKRFILSGAGDGFISYGVRGRTWIAMGDPVGPPHVWNELAWSLRRACDAAGARLCFYQVSGAMLPVLVDLGMDVMKYGEEAHVCLHGFSLEGRHAKDLRYALRRAAQERLAFEVVPPHRVDRLLPELRAVSDAWLAGKGGREKRFSLGAFDADYLCRFPIAVIRRDDRVIAFANIWSAPGGEVSVDLMRHLPDQAPGTMDLMFVRLFEWGRAHGFTHFNLGVAPLSGLPGGHLAPLWAKVGRLLFEQGGRWYAFEGLRAWKAKFRPSWHARYIGRPRGPSAIPALLGLAAVVNRGASTRVR